MAREHRGRILVHRLPLVRDKRASLGSDGSAPGRRLRLIRNTDNTPRSEDAGGAQICRIRADASHVVDPRQGTCRLPDGFGGGVRQQQ